MMCSDQSKGLEGNRFTRASLTGIGIRALGAACGFLFNVVLARTLGRAGTGSVMFYLNFAAMIGLIATGGMDVVGLRELSRAGGNRSRIAAVLADLASSALPSLALFLTVGFVFLVLWGPSLAGAGNAWTCFACTLMLGLTALQKMLSDWLIALGDFLASQLVFYFLNRVASLILIAPVVSLAIGASASAQSFIWVYGAGLATTVLYAIARISTHVSGRPSLRRRPSMPLLRDGVSCAMQNAAFILLNLSPFLLLGAFSTASELGLFGVSQRLVAIVILALTTISQLAMRDFSRAFGDRDFAALARALTTSMRLTFVAATGLTIPLVVFAPVWVLVFGKSFAAAAPTLALLSTAVCAQCFGMPFQAALLTTNNERVARNVTFVCAAIGIALNVAFIPRLGAPGAVLGTGTGLALQSLGHAICAFRVLSLRVHLPVFEIVPRLASKGIR
ncbi:MAG TPA: polysaccharide biosynthesis C-terminal domain-containing protein [Rhizomicrobium sp.]|nr:polysaccharide biosynthesis C-terminal domain-containing protein [Rhizomicrobium sp.]